jgi:hypothetical protein
MMAITAMAPPRTTAAAMSLTGSLVFRRGGAKG